MDCRILVSVIIPTYKNDGSLEKAIDSVLCQSYTNIEIIVVDDNNPDTEQRRFTENLMQKYEGFKNIIYVKQDKNRNGSAARNTGFSHSHGEYIELLDDDDYFVENKTELQVEFLNCHLEFAAVYGGRYEKNNAVVYNKEGDLTEELLSYTILPCTCSLMIRREAYKALNGFNEAYKRHQDFEFLLRFFEKYRIGVIQRTLFYRQANNVDNRLHGKELEQQKKVFLEEFDGIIRNVDARKKGFRRSVYALHFARVFWDNVKYHKWVSAIRILVKYTFVCRTKFFLELYQYAKYYFKPG